MVIYINALYKIVLYILTNNVQNSEKAKEGM